MKYIGRIIFFSCTFFLGCAGGENDAHNIEKKEYHVRVLLEEFLMKEQCTVSLSSTKGFTVVDPDAKTKKYNAEHKLSIQVKKNFFLINDTIFNGNRVYICPQEGYFSFNKKEYHGCLLLIKQDNVLYLINSLDLEDYVCSVLRTESWPGWPLEVNKAFAIASRSYVIGHVLSNKKNPFPYHVKNTNKHQTYSGRHDDPVLKEAVEQTRGIFLAYEGKPIVAMFDSCCGGVIPAHIQGINFLHAPYLERKVLCTFCEGCRMYDWTFSCPLEQFENKLKKEHKGAVKKIKTVTVHKTDKAGLVQHVSVKGAHKHVTVEGKKIYSLFEKVRSFCFDVRVKDNTVVFQGKGVGHHLGLCQWGAREMIRQGYSYKAVLNFYYPGTQFMRLT